MKIISISEKRSAELHSFSPNGHTTITHLGVFNMLGTHFFPSGFKIKEGEVVIYIDPVATEGEEPADYIFLTHTHPDHFSKRDIRKLLKPETVILCSKGVGKKLRKLKQKVRIAAPGEEVELADVFCQAVAAYNTRSIFPGLKAHPKSAENLGFVINLPDGKTSIYHAGDTHHIPEMDELEGVSVALLPIGGNNLTMGSKEAANFCNKLRPLYVVPMHYPWDKLKWVEKFEKRLESGITCLRLR